MEKSLIFRSISPVVLYLQLNRGVILSQNTSILCCYIYLSPRHVSVFVLGHLRVTRYIIEETIQRDIINKILSIIKFDT